MVQVAEFQLYGRIQSLEKVHLTQSKREALLLSFNDAKVRPGIVEWGWKTRY